MGPPARAAGPALVALLKSKQPFTVHFGAAYALVQIGAAEKGGRKLLKVLQHARKENNGYTFIQETEDRLLMVCQDDDPGIRVYAVGCLVQIGKIDAAEALPFLTAGLKADRCYVREFAAKVLGSMGPDAKTAVPALEEALKDRDKPVRRQAAEALKQVDPATAKEAGSR